MINAKDELTTMLAKIDSQVLCASVTLKGDFESDEITATLSVDYTPEEYQRFLDALDVNYNNRYGTTWLAGYVWLEDGSWLEREEYDGSEWWEHKSCPLIPSELKSQNSD